MKFFKVGKVYLNLDLVKTYHIVGGGELFTIYADTTEILAYNTQEKAQMDLDALITAIHSDKKKFDSKLAKK